MDINLNKKIHLTNLHPINFENPVFIFCGSQEQIQLLQSLIPVAKHNMTGKANHGRSNDSPDKQTKI